MACLHGLVGVDTSLQRFMKTASSHFVTVLRKYTKVLVMAAIVVFVVHRVIRAPVPVKVHEVKPSIITTEVMGTGTLEARIKTTITSRIQERLDEVLVDQNDSVKAGQLLARLDDGELKRQVEVADAALAAAKSTAERVRAEGDRAAAVEKQAQLNHKRVSDLMVTKIASQDAFDKAVEAMQVAEAEVKRSQAANIEAGDQVVMAEKNLAYQKERLTFTRLLSPYDGLVVRRDRDPGSVVIPGSSLLQIISTNEIWISSWVDESAMGGLAVGQPVRVVFRSEPDRNYPGKVSRLGRETDRETHEFLVDVRVNVLPKQWTIGQRAEVFIETACKQQVLGVPPEFILWRGGRPGVFVSDNGRATWRSITLGLSGRKLMEVTEGLSQGDKVVAPRETRQSSLRDGLRIKLP